MKNINRVLVYVFIAASLNCEAQDWFCNFESNSYKQNIFFDTVSNPKNLWSVGKPSKSIFNSAYSNIKALVTDTLNVYPINDTSRFTLKFKRFSWGASQFRLQFTFKLNTDTISDFGLIETSIDSGKTWINLLTLDSIYHPQWLSPKPVLSGNSSGWQNFYLYIPDMRPFGDTILFRFSFYSDSIQTNKDGWIIDDIQIHNIYEGIDEITSSNNISIYPNPASSELNIAANSNEKLYAQLFDISGKSVSEKTYFTNNTSINLEELKQGLYFIQIRDANNRLVHYQKVSVVK